MIALHPSPSRFKHFSARDNFALGVKSEIEALLVFMSDREYEKNVEFATKRLAAQRAFEAHALFIRNPVAPCKEFVQTGRVSPA
jgi:hypothetical protein